MINSVPIDSLVNDPNNARRHNQKNLEAIKGSLTKFGQQKPIIVNKENVVIAGNGTLEAARSLGWKQINVIVSELDPTNQKAFALADNRTAELATWDDETLGKQLHDLFADGFDIGSIGFELDEKAGGTGEAYTLEQTQTQSNEGGMTDLYLDSGTYIKSFYSVMYHPSSVKIKSLTDRIDTRLHHSVTWKNTTPMILRESIKKVSLLTA